ncbi:MAG: aminopeptidase N [Succinivibrio sp.]|nr:aminopeptidase N [Succinivibrio sp.]
MDKANTYVVQKRLDYKPAAYTCTDVSLTFDLDEQRTVVKSVAHYKRLSTDESAPLELDGDELELLSVSLNGAGCNYTETLGGLTIQGVPAEFELTIENAISPINNRELMGLYKSNGVFCTQCEPQGFRRITYFLDRPDVLAKYKVTIFAPQQGVGVLLSNGNLIEEGTAQNRRFTVWEDPFPKPSYLFALVAGTFDVVKDEYTTATGNRVSLELYVDKGNYERGLWAMQSIKTAMKWDETRFNLSYDLHNFKVVAVDFFNQGAMENKSLNIFNSIYVLVNPESATDNAFYNVESVIGHEYFHNYTGDRVTLRDWFQLSLKESLTVFRDQEFSSDVASRTLTRLGAINIIRSNQFAEDASPMSHPVRPEEVMEMNNFYTVTIYDKGAEVIRMIHTLIGEERFKQGLALYLKRYDGQAVTIDDFIHCMQEVSGHSFAQFMNWYTQDGTPKLQAVWTYDKSAGKLKLTLRQHTNPTLKQKEKQPFEMPIRLNFIAKDGSELLAPEQQGNEVIVFNAAEQDYIFSVPEDSLPVVLRDFSAPVKFEGPYKPQDYKHMLSYSSDAFIKVNSAVQLTNLYVRENLKHFESQGAALESKYGDPQDLIESYTILLDTLSADTDLFMLNEALKLPTLQALMENFDQVNLDALHQIRCALELKLALALQDKVESLCSAIKPDKVAYSVKDMGRRAVRNTLRHLNAVALRHRNAEQAVQFVADNYRQAGNMTDRLAALTDAVHLDLACKTELLSLFEQTWHNDALVMDNFFRVQATAPYEGTVAQVKQLMSHPCYDDSNPNRIRALPGAMALANPVALHSRDGSGYNLLCEVVKQLNSVNPHVGARILSPLLSFKRFDTERQAMIKERLTELKNLPNLSRSIFEKVTAALS